MLGSLQKDTEDSCYSALLGDRATDGCPLALGRRACAVEGRTGSGDPPGFNFWLQPWLSRHPPGLPSSLREAGRESPASQAITARTSHTYPVKHPVKHPPNHISYIRLRHCLEAIKIGFGISLIPPPISYLPCPSSRRHHLSLQVQSDSSDTHFHHVTALRERLPTACRIQV